MAIDRTGPSVTRMEVKGLADLDALLKTLPARLEANVIRGALRAGQGEIRKQARANLDAYGLNDNRALRNSIRVAFSRRTERRGWVQATLIAGNRLKPEDPKSAWYSHFIEFGTASYYEGVGRTVGRPYEIKAKEGMLAFSGVFRKSVTHPGIKPSRFMREALDAKSGEALERFAEYIRNRLPAEVEKARNR